MRRLGLIIQREYLQTVGKKSFLFTTILLPVLLIALCLVLPIALANVKSDDKKTVAVVDCTAGQQYASAITDTDEYRFVTADGPMDGVRLYEYYLANKEQLDLYAVVQLPDSLAQTARFLIYSDQSVNGSLEREVSMALERVIESERMASYGIEGLEEIMETCRVDVEAKTVKWNEEGDEQLSSAFIGEMIGIGLSFLTYMFVLMYGSMIMNSVIEEKTNRIVEVIVSTCKPMELMLGKIIGVALVGFTQIAIWIVLVGIGMLVFGTAMIGGTEELAGQAGQMAEMATDDGMAELMLMLQSVNYVQILACFVFYFLGGYLLYASLFASLGSAVDQASDASQFMVPIMVIMVFALYAGMFCLENPDGPLAWWCSIIPFTSPIVMMVRLPYGVPMWEIALSIVLLFGCAAGILYLAGRIYRTGILMYGRKVSFTELLKWLRN